MANLQNELNINTQAINNPPLRTTYTVEIPTFSGGNQDPIGWLEDFQRACNANGITDARKLQIAPAHLKGPASTWWTTNQALPNGNNNRITSWNDNNDNTDFIHNFPIAFQS